jgi:molybdopterin synthase sulfur carrier subunit
MIGVFFLHLAGSVLKSSEIVRNTGVSPVKTIKLLATLRDIVGDKTIDVSLDGVQTVRDLAQSIRAAYPALGQELVQDNGELTGKVHILVNGRNIEWLDGLDTPVKESDILILLPPSAGG